MFDLSIIIINYNTKNMTENLIKSIINKTKNISYEIIVVDNSSLDSEKINLDFQQQKNIKIVFEKNNGFGAACNRGAEIASGTLLLFINSDVIFEDDVISPCVEYINLNHDVGVLGCKLILRDGSLDHGCKRGFPTPQASLYYYLKLDKKYPDSKKYGAYRLTYLNNNEINEVDAVSGAFLMIKNNIFKKINGFDENFFMYGEDLDLCFRVKQNKYKIIYFPDVVVTHLKGQSGLSAKNKFVIYNFYKAMIIFYNKHYKKKYNILISRLVYLAVWSKYLLDLLVLRLK